MEGLAQVPPRAASNTAGCLPTTWSVLVSRQVTPLQSLPSPGRRLIRGGRLRRVASCTVRTTRRGNRAEEEIHDAPAERRAARHGPPLDGSAAALCRTGGSRGGGDS